MTITKSGELASFYTVNKAPIKHLKVYFSPKQAGTGDPSPENVREISGWNGVEVTHCGKNLFNPANVIMNYELYPAGDLYPTGTSNNWCVSDYMPVKPNTTYIATALLTKGSGRYALYDENKNYIRGAQEKSGADAQTIITTDANARYIRLTIRIGDKLNTILEESVQENTRTYYPSQAHTLDWTNDIGTVYGGYVDLVTGELVQEWSSIYADGITVKANSSYNQPDYNKFGAGIVYCNPVGLSYVNNERHVFCSTLPTNPMGYGNLPDEDLLYCPYAGQLYVVFYIGRISDHPEITTKQQRIDFTNAWLQEHPTTIVYKLKDPITHQLSPTALSTLIGRNNIWSNADRVEVEYDLAESNDELYRRRNILLRGYPHTESTNGNLVTFNTDVIGKFNEFKINFLPIQNKEGIPSFDNIKNIYGWTNLQTAQCQSLIPLIPTNFNPIVQNGMTLEYLDNNTFYLSGTLTETTNVTIPIQSFTVSNETFGIYIIFERYGASGSGSKNFYLGFLNNDKSIMGFTVPSNEQIVYTTYAYKENINDTINQMQILFTKGWQNVKLRIYLISGNSIRLSTNWSNLAQEIYGGYEDLTTVGTIVKSYNDFTIGGGNNLTIAGDQYCGEYGTDVFAYIPNDCTIKNYTEITDTNLFCDCFSLVKYGVWTHPDSNIGNATLNARTQFHMVFNNANVGIVSSDSANDRKIKISNYLNSHNVKVVYACNPIIVY